MSRIPTTILAVACAALAGASAVPATLAGPAEESQPAAPAVAPPARSGAAPT